jgi:TolB protein
VNEKTVTEKTMTEKTVTEKTLNEKTLTLCDTGVDIGDVGAAGSVSFDDGSYRVTGSGYNMWFGEDAFHFVWTKVEGDLSLSADISFEGVGADPHRKGCLIVRQSLDPDSVYAGIAVHGDGLTSLQYRDERGADTHEVQSIVTAPARVAIERRGGYVSASVDDRPSGGSVRLDLEEPFYIGLAVCSHVRGVAETVRFSEVVISAVEPGHALFSTLETIEIASTDRRTVQVFDGHIEAPNWTADDRLVYNGGGLLYSIPSTGGASIRIDSGFATACNNDHGLSPDGSLIAISDQSQGDGRSVIYTVPIGGGAPVRITDRSPSYWHGWSPDGGTLAFCGERDGSFGIFTIPASGGDETRLTTAVHLDDGPEYSPDGEWIYFNSDRTGLMQIYRMHTDGSSVERVTDDDRGNWFPHLSPDGRWMVFVSYDAAVEGHPADKDVRLQLLELDTGSVTTIAKLFGGQGTINVPSWSPDSTRIAFVSYSYL